MELANLWQGKRSNPDGIRVATKSDAGAISRLVQTSVYSHLHVDWYLPGDWIGSPGFVVVPKVENRQNGSTLTAKLFQNDTQLVACLAATPDPLPAAWVRVAALAETETAEQYLHQMLAQVVPVLRQQGVTQLAWLTVEEWANAWLPQWGFRQGSYIETYVKEDRWLPDVSKPPWLTIRQAYTTDYEALARLEAIAFNPIWRLSAQALAVARPQSLSLDVALLAEEIVGYQLSARSESGVHLVRLTVHPEKQGLGIGSALLTHAFAYYHRRGFYTVSLNTQVENISSQKLYLKFGFKPSEPRLPVWILDIA